MAYNFNNDPIGPQGANAPEVPTGTSQTPETPATTEPTAPAAALESPAFVRFRSCRWQQPKDEGSAEFCTHREVKPYAGTSGFDADAWCTDCQLYKLRRSPKKRQPEDDYSY